jgi:hypothetical protein
MAVSVGVRRPLVQILRNPLVLRCAGGWITRPDTGV